MTGIERCIECVTLGAELGRHAERNLLEDGRRINLELATRTRCQSTGKGHVGQLAVTPRFERFQFLDRHLQCSRKRGNVQAGSLARSLQQHRPGHHLTGPLLTLTDHGLIHRTLRAENVPTGRNPGNGDSVAAPIAPWLPC